MRVGLQEAVITNRTAAMAALVEKHDDAARQAVRMIAAPSWVVVATQSFL